MLKNIKNISPFGLILTFLSGVLLLFIIAPIAGMYLNTPISSFTDTIKDEAVRDSIWLSLWTSMGATLIFAFLAIPFSYLLARKDFPFKNFINGLVDVPIIIPHSAAGIAVLGIITRESFLGKTADLFGWKFVGHPAGIIMAMAFVSIPFLINAARDGFSAVPVKLEKIALTMGASPLRVFLTISLPLAWRSVLSGLIMMWARGMSEFGAVIIIAYNPQTAPVMIFERFSAFGLKYSVPAAAIFVAVSLAIFLILRLINNRKADAESR